MKLMQRNSKYVIFFSQEHVWICCNYEAVACQTGGTP